MKQKIYRDKAIELQKKLRDKFPDIVVNADFFEVNENIILVVNTFWNHITGNNYNDSHSIHYDEIPNLQKMESDILEYFHNLN